jgi:hypothetical protein
MLHLLAIIVDDDFQPPIYIDPEPEDLDPDLWTAVRQIVVDVAEGELAAIGARDHADVQIAWRSVVKNGLTFVCVVEDVETGDAKAYLKDLAARYFDEVDDVRRPERDGVADVVVDVIPPWD